MIPGDDRGLLEPAAGRQQLNDHLVVEHEIVGVQLEGNGLQRPTGERPVSGVEF